MSVISRLLTSTHIEEIFVVIHMSHSNAPSTEGEAPFTISGIDQPCKTWYQVHGDLKSSDQVPLVIVHGGPGFSHDYLKSLSALTSQYGIPVVVYDQVGNGRSSLIKEKEGDAKFWTIQLFMDELHNLIAHLGIEDKYDLLGHSWGGVLVSEIAVLQPKGLRRLIIASALSSEETWHQGSLLYRKKFPQDIQVKFTFARHRPSDLTY